MWHPKLTKRKYQHNSMEYKREYASWYSMQQRCYNVNKDNYSYYGGRGITVCDRWLNSFDDFVLDMGARPIGKTLDRIDFNGNYEPSNCRWATQSEQTINSSWARMISDDDGEVICLDQFAKKHNISPSTVKCRLDRGLSVSDAKKPPKEKHQVEVVFKGESFTMRGLRKRYPFAVNTYMRRVRSGVDNVSALVGVFSKVGISCVASDFSYREYGFEYKSLIG